MRSIRLFTALCLGAAIFILGSAVAPAAADNSSKVKVLLDGLNSPKGLALAGSDLVIGQGAFGPPDPVLVYPLRGPDKGEPFPVTEPLALVDVAISPRDGTGWGLGSDQTLYHELPDGTIEEVINFAEYQSTDPDPHDLEGNPTETNPYGLTVLPNGDALVVDAAGNDLIRVRPNGNAWTVATFTNERTRTNHLPFPFPERFTLSEAVPTTVTLGPGGTVLVGQLQGFPFRPGTSEVWKINPDARDAQCRPFHPTRNCTAFAHDLTAIQDIAFSKDNGKLYVYQLASDVLSFEAGFEPGGVFPPAILLELKNNRRHQLARGELSQPGGIVVQRNGTVFVTDGMFTGGRLLRVG
jgi:hypothetical protein